MVTTGKTRTKKPHSRSQKFKKAVLGRPQGAIQKRVQAVGPEKFGVVAVDCVKARSKWMLTSFYGNVLTPPTNVEHDRSSFQLAVLTLKQAGQKSVTKWLDDAKIRFHKATIERVVVWAANAADPDPMAIIHTRVWTSQLEDWTQENQQIDALERDLAGILAKTPYVLLLSHPGINVVTAAELAGEMGPIENYASAKAVCGRAGLFPSRYQSDEVDRTGKLTRFRNAKLRAAWLLIADNMCKCNRCWIVKAEKWKSEGHKSQDIRCRIANRMTRIVFKMVSGRQLYKHPSRAGSTWDCCEGR